ncbi:MAG: hypothetical protein C4527_16620 [Candidatus Omnitrophota bacterium]|jgi:hypothetical protein|nr:MAG: hypothetical protein C4527_16620 [Candidatus Omnitrophota bacterium]
MPATDKAGRLRMGKKKSVWEVNRGVWKGEVCLEIRGIVAANWLFPQKLLKSPSRSKKEWDSIFIRSLLNYNCSM